MHHSPFPLAYTPEDLELLDVEGVARQLRVSRAFVRVCVSAGCPVRKGRLSAAELLEWLFQNYNQVRVAAGWKPFAPVEGVPPSAAKRLRMANALFTMFDFAESRATDPEQKRQLRETKELIEHALERY